MKHNKIAIAMGLFAGLFACVALVSCPAADTDDDEEEQTPTTSAAVPSAPMMALVNDTGNDNNDGITTDATIALTGTGGSTLTVTITTNGGRYVLAGRANQIRIPQAGTTNVDFGHRFASIVPSGNETNVIVVTATVSVEGQTSPASEKLEFTLVEAMDDEAISLSLEVDSAITTDGFTTNANVVISGTPPAGAELAFEVLASGSPHNHSVTTSDLTTDFGIAAPATGVLPVSVRAKFRRRTHTVRSEPLNYMLFTWPESIEVTYEDDNDGDSDGITTFSELTFAGFLELPPEDLKISKYIITNLSTGLKSSRRIRNEADRPSLSAEYTFDMRTREQTLEAHTAVHSITVDYHGHQRTHVFGPPLRYYDVFTFNRKFALFPRDTSRPVNIARQEGTDIAITPDDVMLLAIEYRPTRFTSFKQYRVVFFDLNGNSTNLEIDHDADTTTPKVSTNYFGTDIADHGEGGDANDEFASPGPLVVGSDGKIYVADDGTNDRIQIFNADFSYDATITGLNGVVSLKLHDGHLFVTRNSVNEVKTYATNDLMEGTSIIRSRSSFRFANLEVLGINTETDTYHTIDLYSGIIAPWTGSPTTSFTFQGGTEAAPLIYTTSPTNDSDGSPVPGSSAPNNLVVGPTTGRLYIADAVTHQVLILEYDSTATENPYTLVGSIGRRNTEGNGISGTDDGHFNRPQSMALHNGELFVVDEHNDRVQVFDVPE